MSATYHLIEYTQEKSKKQVNIRKLQVEYLFSYISYIFLYIKVEYCSFAFSASDFKNILSR